MVTLRTARKQNVIIVVAIGLLLVAGLTWAVHDLFTSKVPGANDFFSRWAGAHLFLTQGWDPYGPETSLWIQQVIYGHRALPGQDPSLFAYPFYTIFLIAPYALLPYDWAQAAWQVTLLITIQVTLFWVIAYFRWRPSLGLQTVLALWMLGFYPSARSLILGQFGLIVFLFTVAAFWLLFRNEQPCRTCDLWAGVLLGLSTVKPQMQFLIIPFLLLWAVRQKRWHLWIGFDATIGILISTSFLLIPSWLGEWIGQVQNYPAYTPPAVLDILTQEVVPLGSAAGYVQDLLIVLLASFLLWQWWRALRFPNEAFRDWVLGLTLVVTHLIAPRTATTHFVVFIFVLIPVYRDLSRRRPAGMLLLGALLVLLLVGMWWLFGVTLAGAQEANIVHVPLPLGMLILVLLVRPQLASDSSSAAP